ncbi:hypothetical protein ACFWY5_18020 [Nonomuraea sp. NPDC059007]
MSSLRLYGPRPWVSCSGGDPRGPAGARQMALPAEVPNRAGRQG